MAATISFKLNGERVRLEADENRKLLWVLRTELEQTGTKYGCGRGSCGACVVLVNDNPIRSCMADVGSVRGKEVLTIEGLAKGDELHPLQKAFIEHDALQCGFCTPGMVMAVADLLAKNPKPSEAEIRSWLKGNICRCTGYHNIVKAALIASGQREADPVEAPAAAE